VSELYTSSRLRVLRDCIARHYYQYVLCVRTPSTPQMAFGTVAHAALEAYFLAWKAGRMEARLADAIAAVNASALSPIDRTKLQALVVAYHLKWGACEWEILAVEVEFRYVLDGNLIGGKIDALIRDRDGRVYVLEHKTSSADTSPGSVYWERLALDSQVSIYVDGATMLGHEIAGCIYDVLKRPEHEQKLATPVESRRYTQGKGCAKCGGSAGGKKGIIKGAGHTRVVFASEVKSPSATAASRHRLEARRRRQATGAAARFPPALGRRDDRRVRGPPRHGDRREPRRLPPARRHRPARRRAAADAR
jgi:hypothetical protein